MRLLKTNICLCANKGAPVVPLLYKDCPLPLALTSLQYIDFVHKSFGHCMRRVAQRPPAFRCSHRRVSLHCA